MSPLSRRTLIAAAGTVAMAVPLRNSRAVTLQGVDALQTLDPPHAVEVAWTTADGAAKTLADYAGQGVVLNLWATWCSPCVAEMPALDRFAAAMASSGIAVLPLSSDLGGRHAVEAFYTDERITTLPVLLDPRSAAAHALGVRGIPTTFVIDRRGMAVALLEGTLDWNTPAVIDHVRHLVGERKRQPSDAA